MLNIISALVLNIVVSSSAYVDRVETDDRTYTAVVCMGAEGACFDVATHKGGMSEGELCETHKRLDGTSAVVCGGSVVAFVRADGSTLRNPYAMPASAECGQY